MDSQQGILSTSVSKQLTALYYGQEKWHEVMQKLPLGLMMIIIMITVSWITNEILLQLVSVKLH